MLSQPVELGETFSGMYGVGEMALNAVQELCSSSQIIGVLSTLF